MIRVSETVRREIWKLRLRASIPGVAVFVITSLAAAIFAFRNQEASGGTFLVPSLILLAGLGAAIAIDASLGRALRKAEDQLVLRGGWLAVPTLIDALLIGTRSETPTVIDRHKRMWQSLRQCFEDGRAQCLPLTQVSQARLGATLLRYGTAMAGANHPDVINGMAAAIRYLGARGTSPDALKSLRKMEQLAQNSITFRAELGQLATTACREWDARILEWGPHQLPPAIP